MVSPWPLRRLPAWSASDSTADQAWLPAAPQAGTEGSRRLPAGTAEHPPAAREGRPLPMPRGLPGVGGLWDLRPHPVACYCTRAGPDVRMSGERAMDRTSVLPGATPTLPVDRSVPIPLYYQVAQILRSRVLAGDFAVGSELPSERQIQLDYGISRHTARQAIELLVSEGLIRREQGRGTYVLPQGLRLRSRLDTFFEHRAMLAEFGYAITVQHLSTRQCAPDQGVRDALRLGPSDEVICFTKLFLADARPAILAKDFVPLEAISGAYDEQGAGADFFRFIEDLVGHRIEYLISDVVPTAAEDEVASALQIPLSTPLLLLRELFLDASQQIPIQFAYNYHNPELISYTILRKRRQP